MSDIVERLLNLADEWCGACDDIHVPLTDAAYEIRRLREELKHAHALADTLRKAIGVTGWTPNAALGEGKE